MKKIFIFAIFILAIRHGQSQKITIVDKLSLQPVVHAKVWKGSIETSQLTDSKGMVHIENILATDTVYVSAIGYSSTFIIGSTLIANKYRFEIIEKIYDLNEVVVSASKFSEKKDDIPFQVQSINATELKHMNQQTMADVIQNSGNVMVQKSQQGGGSPIIRGFEASRVLMVVDGVRMNNAIYRAGHLQNVITLDNTAMDKVEIVFGPSSTVYGSDALGGVMHFHTKTPVLSDENKGKVSANAFTRYSTANNEKSGHVDFNIGWKKFASFSSITYSDFGDLRMGNNRNDAYGTWGQRNWYQKTFNGKDSMVVNNDRNIQVGSGYKQWDVLQKFLIQQNEKVSHILNFQYSNSSNVPRYDRLTQLSGGMPRFAEWYYGPQKRLFGSYSLQLKNEKGIYDNARIILSYQNIEESRMDRRFNRVFLNHQIEKLDIVALNADFSKQIKKNEFRYGIEAAYNKVNSTAYTKDIVMDTTAAIPTRYPDGGSDYRSLAAYFTHTWEASEEFVITDGIRFTNINLHSQFDDTTFFPFPFKEYTQNNSAVTGSLGLIFKPGYGFRFNLTGSTGFRAPNVDDLSKVFESTPGNITVPNPDIKPEYTYNLDLGIQKVFNKKISLNVVGYYTWYKNYIGVLPGTFNGQDSILFDGALSRVVQAQNVTDAYLYGLSANLVADINDNFSISSSINYTYGRIKTDTTDSGEYPLDHVAPVFGKTSFIFKTKRFRSEFYTMYSGWKNLTDYNFVGEDNISLGSVNNNATEFGMPAWVTLNLRASFQISKNLMLQAALENITDQHYRVFGSNISAAGRNLVLTLRGSF